MAIYIPSQCLLYLQNLVTYAPTESLPSMIVANLLPYVRSLATRKFSDEEVMEDVAFLEEELTDKFESMTCVVNLFVLLKGDPSIEPTMSIFPNFSRDICLGVLCMIRKHFGEKMRRDLAKTTLSRSSTFHFIDYYHRVPIWITDDLCTF